MERASSQERHIKRLQWAIWFSQANLSDFRDGDWINLQQDLKTHYLGAARPQDGVKDVPLPIQPEARGHLEVLQGSVNADLRSIAYHEDKPSDRPVHTSPIEARSVTAQGYGVDEPFELGVVTH